MIIINDNIVIIKSMNLEIKKMCPSFCISFLVFPISVPVLPTVLLRVKNVA